MGRHRHRQLQFWLLALGVGLAMVSLWPHRQALLEPQALAQQFHSLGPWREVGFLTAHLVATALGLPGTVLVVAGGAVFGVWWGTLWSVMGATLGAIAAFLIARHCLQDWCRCRFRHSPLLQRIDHRLQQDSLGCVLALRFVPISPFNLVNFAFGITSVRLSAYAIGTCLGIIPGTATYTWLGAAGVQAFSQGEARPLTLALLTLAAFSLAPLLLRHRRKLQKGLCLRRNGDD